MSSTSDQRTGHNGAPGDSSLGESLREFVGQVGEETARKALASLELVTGADPVGSTLGDYELLRRIGSGGMGVVYEAEQRSVPGRRVAIKMLLRTGATERRLTRFAREIEVIGRLDHPNIVPILSADLEGDVPYYAMKLVLGQSLREALGDDSWERRDFRSTAVMFRDLALALQHAHEHGVIHRDLTPRNVMLEPDGRAMLLDFGLAHDERADDHLTLTEDALGTPDYMAPEQVSPRLAPITPATDVYGLGVTLYHCLAGKTPFDGDSRHELLDKILQGGPAPPRKWNAAVPRDLQTICLKAMAFRPAERYVSAQAFAEDLGAFLDYLPIAASPPGSLAVARNWARRHTGWTVAGAVGALALVISTAYWTWVKPSGIVRAMERAYDAGDFARAEEEGRRAKLAYPGSRFERAAEERLADMRRHRADEELRKAADFEAQRADVLARAREAFERRRERRRWPSYRLERGEIASLDRELDAYDGELRKLDQLIEARLDESQRLDPDHSAVSAASADFAARELRRRLDDLDALFDPVTVASWEERLRQHDAGHELLDSTGSLSIDCPQGAARVWLCAARSTADGRMGFTAIDEPGTRLLGTTPVEDVHVPEGSYLLRIRADGYEETLLPWLVRRGAVQSERERTIHVDVHTAETIGAGFRFVPAGLSILGPRPSGVADFEPRLTWVDSFFVSEREISEFDIARLLGRVDRNLVEEPRRLVHDLSWDEIETRLRELNAVEAARRDPTPPFYRLPTPAEWERAGRGADGRRFPWGNVFDRAYAQSYFSSVDRNLLHEPRTWPEEDESPFGVRELSGSFQEPCLARDTVVTVGLSRVLLRGGSLDSRTEEELTLLARTFQAADEREFTTGLRLVKEVLPPLPAEPHAAFEDDFERPDGVLGGSNRNGWRVTTHEDQDLDQAERVLVQDGQLVIEGYADDFSPRVVVWHPVSAPAAPWEVDVRASFTARATTDPNAGSQSLSILLGDRPCWARPGEHPLLVWRRTDLALEVGGEESLEPIASSPDVPHRLVLRCEERRIRAWLAPVGEPLPSEPTVAIDVPSDFTLPPVHYLAIEAGNFAAVRAQVDEIRLWPR